MKYYMKLFSAIAILVFIPIFVIPSDNVGNNMLGKWSWNNETKTEYLFLEITESSEKYLARYCFTTATRINCDHKDDKSISVSKDLSSNGKYEGVLINPYDLKEVNVSLSLLDNTLLWEKQDKDSLGVYVPSSVKMKKVDTE